MKRLATSHFLGAAIICFVSCGAGNCTAGCPSSFEKQLPNSSHAISNWQETRGIYLTDSARNKLNVALCVAVDEVVDETGASSTDIDTKSPDAIVNYLDASASGHAEVNLTSELAVHFEPSSSPRPPGPTMFGTIVMRYNLHPDKIRVGSDEMPPYATVMSELGDFSVTGYRLGKAVCRGTVTVILAGKTAFVC